jgi:hypothetical protein
MRPQELIIPSIQQPPIPVVVRRRNPFTITG